MFVAIVKHIMIFTKTSYSMQIKIEVLIFKQTDSVYLIFINSFCDIAMVETIVYNLFKY